MPAMPAPPRVPAAPALPPVAAYVGIDWAATHHDIACQLAGASAVEAQRVPHTPEALQAWLAALAQRVAGQPVAVALETSRGPLAAALLDVPWIVLYPVNPRSLQRFREVFTPSGAKDDAPDARLLLELLLHHRAKLRPIRPAAEGLRALARLVEHRRALVGLRTRLVQQLQAALAEVFPQALTWAGADLSAPLAVAFLTRWPTLAALQAEPPAAVQRFYAAHHWRRPALLAARLRAIAAATPLTTDPALLSATTPYVQCLVAQLCTLAAGLAPLEEAIAARFAAEADAALFAALPGAGPALAPRLLVAFGSDRARFPAAADVQRAAGIAPITRRSGQTRQVTWRWQASTFLRQSFHEFAQHSIARSVWARAFYQQQRQRGRSAATAVRALAFKWIRILWRCWHDGVPYDEARYLRALRQRGSPLARLLPPDPAPAPAPAPT